MQSAHRLRNPVQTIPAWEEDDCGTGQLGRVGRFSLHAAGGGEHAGAQEAGAYLPDYLSRGAVRGTIGADKAGYGQLWLENSLSGWDYARVVELLAPSKSRGWSTDTAQGKEAGRTMVARQRLIECPMCDGVDWLGTSGCFKQSVGKSLQPIY